MELPFKCTESFTQHKFANKTSKHCIRIRISRFDSSPVASDTKNLSRLEMPKNHYNNSLINSINNNKQQINKQKI